jgi:Protein of unknown function (DUF2975)
MSAQPASGSVRIGYTLVTVLLILALAFGSVALVSIGMGLARDGESLLYGDTLTVPLQLSPDDVGPLPSGVRLQGWPDITVEVSDPTTEQMFLRSATDIGPLLLFIAGLWLMRRFLRSVRDGDPFGAPNVGRLRALGFILVVGAPLVALLNQALRTGLYDNLPATSGSVDIGVAGYTLPGEAMLGGLGAFILAGVFAHGARLREDVEGTV